MPPPFFLVKSLPYPGIRPQAKPSSGRFRRAPPAGSGSAGTGGGRPPRPPASRPRRDFPPASCRRPPQVSASRKPPQGLASLAAAGGRRPPPAGRPAGASPFLLYPKAAHPAGCAAKASLFSPAYPGTLRSSPSASPEAVSQMTSQSAQSSYCFGLGMNPTSNSTAGQNPSRVT